MGTLRNWAVLLTVTASLLTLAAGCGGGGQETERLSEAEWIAQADAICASAAQEIEALSLPTTPGEFDQTTRERMQQAVEIGERQLEDLRDLRPPIETVSDYAKLLELTEEQVEVVRDLSESETETVPRLLEELRRVTQEAQLIKEEYAFQEC